MPRAKKSKSGKSVETLRHEDASRTNIPTAEYQSMVRDRRSRSPSAWPTRGATATWTRSWYGAARTSRTSRTWW